MSVCSKTTSKNALLITQKLPNQRSHLIGRAEVDVLYYVGDHQYSEDNFKLMSNRIKIPRTCTRHVYSPPQRISTFIKNNLYHFVKMVYKSTVIYRNLQKSIDLYRIIENTVAFCIET